MKRETKLEVLEDYITWAYPSGEVNKLLSEVLEEKKEEGRQAPFDEFNRK